MEFLKAKSVLVFSGLPQRLPTRSSGCAHAAPIPPTVAWPLLVIAITLPLAAFPPAGAQTSRVFKMVRSSPRHPHVGGLLASVCVAINAAS